MQAFLYLLPLLANFASISAAPSKALEPRQAASQCGASGSISTGAYTIDANEWGASTGTGSQCSQINGLDGNSLAWQATWSWADSPNNVKAFNNVQSSSTYCAQIGSIGSIPTNWDWSYSGTDVRANVAYDTFVGYSCGGAAAFEVMVWLADMGSQIYPLSNNGYPPTPSASPYIGNAQFNLVIGTEGDLTVYSFVAAQYAEGFSADLLDFYKYLVDNEGFPSSAYLQVIQAGSEVFTGSDAYFSTSSYSISQS